MNLKEEKQRRIRLHFGGRQVAWVPFWGISKLRRRGQVFAGEIPGDLIEYDRWYKHMLSPETFDRLAEMEFNLVILPFSLGGCEQLETQEHEDFRAAAKLCAERGIVPLPYLQYQNVLPESTQKHFSSWAIQTDGTPASYTSYRPTLCQSSSDFREYFNGLIRKSQEYGAAGIWIDNSYLKPCICPDCRRRFANWLRENRKEMLEQLQLIPEQVIISPNASLSDPVQRAFFQFNMERNTELLHGFEQEMRKWNPDGLFASNPGFYREYNRPLTGVDFPNLLRFHDIIYLENHHFTGKYEGKIDGNYRGFADCEALGVTSVSGSWKNAVKVNGIRIKTGMPAQDEIGPSMLEPLLFGGIPGAFWMIREMPDECCRNAQDKLRGYFEFPPMHKALAEVMGIVKTVPAGSSNPAGTGIWFSADSWKYDFYIFEESYYAVTESLTSANIPWRTVFDDEPDSMKDLKLLIVPASRIISDEKIALLKKIADSGTKILVINAYSATLNEKLFRRTDSPLAELAGSSLYSQEEFASSGNWSLLRDNGLRHDPFLNISGPCKFTRPDYAVSGKLVEAVEKLLAPSFRIEGNEVIGTIRRTREGKEFLLLLDYQFPAQEKTVRIRFAEKRSGVVVQPSKENFSFEGNELSIQGFKLFAMIQL